MGNSLIEAQQQFTDCFGELCLSDLCKDDLELPLFSREQMYLEEFIEAHKNVENAAVEIQVSRFMVDNSVHYNFYHK